MDKIIKNVLKKIEDAGFEAYLVGGFVRDYLLGIKSLDVDICTNALPKDLHQMFPSNSNSNTYGGFNLKIKNYNIDITTYRKELKYDKRKPTEIVYIDKLEDDIVRRDFTINSVCMNKEEKIIAFISLEHRVKELKIKDIAVLPEYQSSGIGTELLNFAKEQAIKNNKSKIILGMIYANEKLRIWYEKYGFKIKEIITYPSTGEVAKMEYIIK